MTRGLFSDVATKKGTEKWENCITREAKLYDKENEIRTPFERDYTRILHSNAYRRLKHKTQVFFATKNDHVCTRIEHVNHVNSISKTISNYLGLNTELVDAISIGHDLGHAPFGHKGEETLQSILKDKIPEYEFWHERNSLRFVDSIEVLEDPNGHYLNLLLTYAVRDGIVCHCGEVDENSLAPRDDFIDLNAIEKSNQYSPYTWEGCIVKISDKIAYLGRDIEDATTLDILTNSELRTVNDILKRHSIENTEKLNNTVLIHDFIVDLCKNSNPTDGICLSQEKISLMNEIKLFCNESIYSHPKLERYKKFVDLLLKEIFDILYETIIEITKNHNHQKDPEKDIYKKFHEYMEQHAIGFSNDDKYSKIKKIYDTNINHDLYMACMDFLSGMTDQYALKVFKEAIVFGS